VLEGSFGCSLSLSRKTLQVAEQPHTERILQVKSFHGYQVPCNFGGTLAEADAPVINGQRLWVGIVVSIQACNSNGRTLIMAF
jgi:hypothetical protein